MPQKVVHALKSGHKYKPLCGLTGTTPHTTQYDAYATCQRCRRILKLLGRKVHYKTRGD